MSQSALCRLGLCRSRVYVVRVNVAFGYMYVVRVNVVRLTVMLLSVYPIRGTEFIKVHINISGLTLSLRYFCNK